MRYLQKLEWHRHFIVQGSTEETSCHTAGTVIMTDGVLPLRGYGVLCGVVGESFLWGVWGVIVLMGVWWWACGYQSCVWGFPTGRLICLGLGFVEALIAWGVPTKFVGNAAWGMGVFGTLNFFVLLSCAFSFGGLRVGVVSAGLLLCLFVDMMAS